ncbi:hypothetical protein [Wolbachia pipientis]|uniref:hypothetical protein n=1 Tax=Wolbachia pipientis TaxID=955 RepID=UPI0020B792C2|nr:hypothetical protein [Wolbachia pipientis]
MEKYTFQIRRDGDSFKVLGGLIHLPSRSYILLSTQDKLLVSDRDSKREKNINDKNLILKRQGRGEIVLCDGNNRIYAEVPEDTIISDQVKDLLKVLNEKGNLNITIANIIGSENYCVRLSKYQPGKNLDGILNFVDFYNKDNQILKKYNYLTIEKGDQGYSGCISDSEGKCQNIYSYNDIDNTQDKQTFYSFPVNSIDPDKIDQSLLKRLSNDSYESKISDNLANIINNNEENREIVLRKLQNQEERETLLDFLESDNEIFELIKGYVLSDNADCNADQYIKKLVTKLKNHNQDVNMSLKIIKGENYGEISSAKIVDNQNNDIGTFANIGYFFQNGDLHIRNHITETNIKVPKEFHFLKTVYDREGRLKLALCNSLGNLLSEYKKYDPEYRELPKFVEINHLSLERGEVLKYCYDWRPIFHLKDKTTGGKVDVFKVQQGEKKIGTLIDEFIFYKDNRLHYKNNSDLVEECCYNENLYTGFDNKLSISDINNITINLEQSLNWNL